MSTDMNTAKNVRTFGTVIRGIRTPIITNGDKLDEIVTNCVLNFSKTENVGFNDRDIVGVTEAVVARAQGNYVTVDNIAADVKVKFGAENGEKIDALGVIFPILSRNRFAICLRGIAAAAKKIYLMLSYPSDEVGNHLFDESLIEEKQVNPWKDVLDEKTFRQTFGETKHKFTNVDYIEYYKELITECGAEVEVLFSNSAKSILAYTDKVLCCDIHTRTQTVKKLTDSGGKIILGLDNICTSSVNGSGYNEKYGLLGSNKATEEMIKLFPRDCQNFVDSVAQKLKESTGKNIEVLIYGDGAFKDPQGKIWELADPVVSPAYTNGLDGLPNELKLKYIADNQFASLKGEELTKAVKEYVKNKSDRNSAMEKQGTTPRKLTDLIGSLCDLSSGSGDKGTPVIFIQGYFDTIAD